MGKFATFSGALFDYDELDPSTIRIVDIAHHLARESRFGGAMPWGVTYSVASHSINIVRACMLYTNNIEVYRCALMHDATEAYMKDLPSGIKEHLSSYKKLEANLERIIYAKYNIETKHKKLIKELDKRIVLDEAKAIMPDNYYLYRNGLRALTPIGITIEKNRPGWETEKLFLQYAEEFGIKDKALMQPQQSSRSGFKELNK